MVSRFEKLKDVLVEGISILDTYVVTLNNFYCTLEKESKMNQQEVLDLKLQQDSILSTLSLIKAINRKKISLLTRFSPQKNDKFIVVKFNVKGYNRSGSNQVITLWISLKDYNALRDLGKVIHIRIGLN